MAKETSSNSSPPPEYDAQPPPYSAVAPPGTMQPPIHHIPLPPLPPYPLHPQQYGHHQTETTVHAHVITQQPGSTVHLVTTSPLFGPNPRTLVCNACQQTGSSKIIERRSLGAHVLAMSLCLAGCWLCIPCIYCTDCCMNVEHYCSNCNAYQGTFIRSY